MPIADQLREAIRASGKPVAAIARESGVPQPMLSRFVNGYDLRVATADRLAAYFGLEFTRPASEPRPAGERKKAAKAVKKKG